MSNMFDYLEWRGDISFGSVSLCPADTLILSMLPYVRFEGILPESPSAEPLRLGDVITRYLEAPTVTPANRDHHRLLEKLKDSPRFAPLRLLAAQSGWMRRAVCNLRP